MPPFLELRQSFLDVGMSYLRPEKTPMTTLLFQVCSIDLAKRLKELGAKQDSYFIWSIPNPATAKTEQDKKVLAEQCVPEVYPSTTSWGDTGFDRVAAFTVSELGEMLPRGMIYRQEFMGGRWTCGVDAALGSRLNTTDRTVMRMDTEADARAKMLIYLLENHLIELAV